MRPASSLPAASRRSAAKTEAAVGIGYGASGDSRKAEEGYFLLSRSDPGRQRHRLLHPCARQVLQPGHEHPGRLAQSVDTALRRARKSIQIAVVCFQPKTLENSSNVHSNLTIQIRAARKPAFPVPDSSLCTLRRGRSPFATTACPCAPKPYDSNSAILTMPI